MHAHEYSSTGCPLTKHQFQATGSDKASNSAQAPAADGHHQTPGAGPSNGHVTDSCFRGTVGTVLLAPFLVAPSITAEKNTTRTRRGPPAQQRSTQLRSCDEARWSWGRPPHGKQPPRIPGRHVRGPRECSTQQLTGKSTAFKLARHPGAGSVRKGICCAVSVGRVSEARLEAIKAYKGELMAVICSGETQPLPT